MARKSQNESLPEGEYSCGRSRKDGWGAGRHLINFVWGHLDGAVHVAVLHSIAQVVAK
jgi:hypothetical protein